MIYFYFFLTNRHLDYKKKTRESAHSMNGKIYNTFIASYSTALFRINNSHRKELVV